MTIQRQAVFWGILLAGLLVFAEAASWLMLKILEQRPIGSAMFMVRRSSQRQLAMRLKEALADPFFDSEIGWCRKRASRTVTDDGIVYTYLADGSRLSGATNGPPAVAFYGCSGTMGLEVSDSESYPAQFARLAGLHVKNWGMAGYGMDQSILRFERNLREIRNHPRIAVLGFGEETISRNVSAWRLFYTGENLLKPRFVWKSGRFEQANPVLQDPGPYLNAPDRAILEALAPCDSWLSSRLGNHTLIKPAIEWPFTPSLGRALLFLLGRWSAPLAFPGAKDQTPFNLYDQKEPLELMERLTDRFFDDCRQHDIQGCLVLVTCEFFIDAAAGRLNSHTLRLQKGRGHRLDEHYITYLDRKGYRYAESLPLFVDLVKKGEPLKPFFRPYEHPSERGNLLIARSLFDRMKADGLLPGPGKPEKRP